MIAGLFLWTTEKLNKMISRFFYSLNALSPLNLIVRGKPWKLKEILKLKKKSIESQPQSNLSLKNFPATRRSRCLQKLIKSPALAIQQGIQLWNKSATRL